MELRQTGWRKDRERRKERKKERETVDFPLTVMTGESLMITTPKQFNSNMYCRMDGWASWCFREGNKEYGTMADRSNVFPSVINE